MEEKELSVKEIFESIKDKKEKITHEELKKYYSHCLTLIEKFKITGQKKSLDKLLFHITCMEKEMKLIDMGIDTYINYEDIDKFLKRPENKEILFVELENYPRDIPDEIVETISKTKDIFKGLFIIFTDYTGEIKKELKEKKKKEKDPILLGAFVDTRTKTKLERFYFLGDWEDEYCDLTLEKLVASGVPTHTLKTKSLEEIKSDINSFKETQEKTKTLDVAKLSSFYSSTSTVAQPTPIVKVYTEAPEKKKSFFKRVKSFLKG